MPVSYQIDVKKPCTGNQIVSEITSTFYAGGQGTFTYGTLALPPGATKWQAEITDFSGGGCTPSAKFEQKVGNTSDPTGDYEEAGGGTGEATVSEYP